MDENNMDRRRNRKRDRAHFEEWDDASRKKRERSRSHERERNSDNWRDGDWICEKCSAHNYSRRSTCFKCGTFNENSSSNRISGLQDWDCATCKTFNFARRKACFKCNATRKNRPASAHLASTMYTSFRSRGYDRKGVRSDRQFKDGDWICPGCRKHNFARRLECFGCGISRNAPKTSYVNPASLPPTKSSLYVPSELKSNFAQSEQVESRPRPPEFIEQDLEDDFPRPRPRISKTIFTEEDEDLSRASNNRSRKSRFSGGPKKPAFKTSPREPAFAKKPPRESAFAKKVPRESAFAKKPPRESAFTNKAPRESAFAKKTPSESAFVKKPPRESAFAKKPVSRDIRLKRRDKTVLASKARKADLVSFHFPKPSYQQSKVKKKSGFTEAEEYNPAEAVIPM